MVPLGKFASLNDQDLGKIGHEKLKERKEGPHDNFNLKRNEFYMNNRKKNGDGLFLSQHHTYVDTY
jgi:hypothetical protein